MKALKLPTLLEGESQAVWLKLSSGGATIYIQKEREIIQKMDRGTQDRDKGKDKDRGTQAVGTSITAGRAGGSTQYAAKGR